MAVEQAPGIAMRASKKRQTSIWHIVGWIVLGLSAGLAAGFVTGLLRRRTMAESATTYTAPPSAEDRTVPERAS